MNDKIRFVVLTTLMVVGFPVVLVFVFAAWLGDVLDDVRNDYMGLYRKAWRSK